MLGVVYYDLTRYLIPNWLNGLLLALYPVMLLMNPLPVDWMQGLMVMGGCFAAGFAIFALRIMGGGDVKMLTVCGLWTGAAAIPDFLFVTALLGGLLTLLLIVLRYAAAWWFAHKQGEQTIPRLLTYGEPVPYGLAISGAFLILLWMGKLPGLPVV